MADDLDGISVFVTVAETSGFRAAGERLGVSGSAVSQSIRRLEERLGVTLVRRTTRSVSLTEAGERLLAAVRPALEEMRAAVVAVGELADQPRGKLRLSVASAAESFLREATLEGFLAAFPDISLEIIVDEDDRDIVAGGYDAGVRLGEVIDKDMIAIPASAMQRLIVVGSPGYFERHGAPAHPRELAGHPCINWRPSADAPPYRWEFTENGLDFTVAVEPRVITNDAHLMFRLASAGLGLAIGMEERARAHIERGELVAVLEEYCLPFPGYYLYYPQRRHASPALRALVDYLRERTRKKRAPASGRKVRGGPAKTRSAPRRRSE